jgi:hypothetical protein
MLFGVVIITVLDVKNGINLDYGFASGFQPPLE